MPIFTSESKLCEIILHEPEIITVINRFGIYLGVGEATVSAICKKQDIDIDFFLSILNTYINENYFPENVLNSNKVKQIVGYLRKTNSYYEHIQLPNIERHFNSLVSHSHEEKNNNLSLLQKFFLEMKSELLSEISRDNDVRFPILLNLRDNICLETEFSSDHFENSPDPIEDKIDDLLSFFIIHLRGQYDVNLCRAVVSALFSLSKDIRQNNRIRRRILKPLWISVKENKNLDD